MPLYGRGLKALSIATVAMLALALSLVFFAARYASPIYQTLGLLIVAYVVRFLTEALAGTGSALAAARSSTALTYLWPSMPPWALMSPVPISAALTTALST